jgi:citrate lyase beta subunit
VALETMGSNDFRAAIDIDDEVYARVEAKLRTEPIEDLRIDFEDGYGAHSDAQENETAVAAAEMLAAGGAPPFVGIRFKSFEAATRDRGIATIDLFIATLAARGGLPSGFVMTLPKVTRAEQVAAMADVCDGLESAYHLAAGSVRFEIQIETPQAVIGADGTVAISRMIQAARGRCTGLHYGTYDYSAACGVSAAYQSMAHPVADYAKAVMQVAAAGTGVRLSDGSTNVLPVGDRDAVYEAWRLHFGLVRRSLERAFYQGWDLHAAQLPTRFAATYTFYREGLAATAGRLRAYMSRASVGVLDEPATAQALAGYLLRGLNCGALDPAELVQAAGTTEDALVALASRRIG